MAGQLSNENVVTQVNALMHEGFEIPFEKLTPSATVFGDLGLDSLDAVDMLVNLEDRIGVKVDVERLKSVKTLQDIYNLVQDLSGAAQINVQVDQ
jgi:acyl carrier protein